MRCLVEVVVTTVVEADTVEEAMEHAEKVLEQETQDLRLDDHNIVVDNCFASVAAEVEQLSEDYREEIRTRHC